MDSFHETYMKNPIFVKECMYVLKQYLEPRLYYLSEHGEWTKMKGKSWITENNEKIIIDYEKINFIDNKNNLLSEEHKSFTKTNTCMLIHELFRHQKGIYRDSKYCIHYCYSWMNTKNYAVFVYPCGRDYYMFWHGFKNFMKNI